MTNYRCYASCSFGIEGILANELRDLGFQGVAAQDARVYFDADVEGVALANVFLRTADRVYIVLEEFEANNFEALFESVRSVDFASMIPSDARIPVDANAVRSDLMSVSDIQSVSKKAIVKSMQKTYGAERLPENGNVFNIFINIYKNRVTVALNTSGTGLNRRGYRLKNVQAPLKETLAAALILISRWTQRAFYDPMCGSGTIVIEAAMIAADMAPGINRKFDSANYSNEFRTAFARAREMANDKLKKPSMQIHGSDIDKRNLKLAQEHAHNMKMGKWIDFGIADARRFVQPDVSASIITNPPYAVRLGETQEVERLYKDLGKAFQTLKDTLVFILCANDQFERFYGRKADKKRKLYNGNLKCTYYQYFRKERT